MSSAKALRDAKLEELRQIKARRSQAPREEGIQGSLVPRIDAIKPEKMPREDERPPSKIDPFNSMHKESKERVVIKNLMEGQERTQIAEDIENTLEPSGLGEDEKIDDIQCEYQENTEKSLEKNESDKQYEEKLLKGDENEEGREVDLGKPENFHEIPHNPFQRPEKLTEDAGKSKVSLPKPVFSKDPFGNPMNPLDDPEKSEIILEKSFEYPEKSPEITEKPSESLLESNPHESSNCLPKDPSFSTHSESILINQLQKQLAYLEITEKNLEKEAEAFKTQVIKLRQTHQSFTDSHITLKSSCEILEKNLESELAKLKLKAKKYESPAISQQNLAFAPQIEELKNEFQALCFQSQEKDEEIAFFTYELERAKEECNSLRHMLNGGNFFSQSEPPPPVYSLIEDMRDQDPRRLLSDVGSTGTWKEKKKKMYLV